MSVNYEQRALKFSVYGAIFFAVLGLVWGFIIKSQMILFDAIYSFISVMLSIMSVYAAKTMLVRDDKNFPFGKSQLEPMVVMFKSLVIIAMCAKAFSDAFVTFTSGGRDINTISAIIYAVIGTLGCFICWHYIRWIGKSKSPNSELVKAEGIQWGMDTLISLAVFLGFLAAFIMQKTGYGQYARYMDSLMVMAVVLFFIRTPALSFISGIKELLMMAPKKDIYPVAKEAMEKIARERGFADVILRAGRGGRDLVFEVSFVLKDPNEARSISEMDAIHRLAKESLGAVFDKPVWMTVSFVYDRQLA